MVSRRHSRFATSLIAFLSAVACTDGPGTAPLNPATIITVANEHQFGVIDAPVTLLPSVVVRDDSGNPVAGIRVNFVPSSGGGTVTDPQPLTDANGVATVGGWTLGTAVGENRLTVSLPGYTVVPAIIRADALGKGFALDSITAGTEHTCGLDGAGAAFCWGSNTRGNVGDGTLARRLAPVRVGGGQTFKAIAAGSHSCALTSAGAAWCWGPNQEGQLGDGSNLDASVPRRVTGSFVFANIFAGEAHTCALTAEGRAYCWGDNSSGQLGDGTFIDRSTPVPVAGNLSFRNLSPTGGDHTCGVTTGGVAYCWGDNSRGALGDNTQINRALPVVVAGQLNFAQLYSDGHTCGLTTTGAAYCWGDNTNGELGDGTNTIRRSPVSVTGGHVFQRLETGVGATCGIVATGVAYCWGVNSRGQLGDGTLANRTAPVVAARGMRFRRIAMSLRTCGVTLEHGAYCWGDNTSGALGSGSTFSSAGPLPVLGP